MYEQKAVGMQSVAPAASCLTNAGDVQSQAVYPLASNVARRPPDGIALPAYAPFINSFPEKLISTFPFGIGEVINESCFSAVTPVSGWNQCV